MPKGKSAKEYKFSAKANKIIGIIMLIALILGIYFSFGFLVSLGFLENEVGRDGKIQSIKQRKGSKNNGRR